MRIAYITYEYPPDIAKGGIATYVDQVARIMKRRGHNVEVFCGSNYRTVTELNEDGVVIHRVKCKDHEDFRHSIVSVFEQRHNQLHFDIMESPEINGNAYEIKLKFPAIPLVLKLHMALFIQMRLLNFYMSWLSKLRFFLGGLRRGKINIYGTYKKKDDIDYKIAMLAEGISSPSKSLKEIITKEWLIDGDQVDLIPYPFIPSKDLLNIPIAPPKIKTVTFTGKLNVHKGLVNLVKAIPLVVQNHPDVKFILIGNDSSFHVRKQNMSTYIKKQLMGYETNYEFTGGLAYEDVLKFYGATSICVFPSIWENYPLVCLEAMSAGKAIVGSKNGGMSEMLEGNIGIIVDPLDHKAIASAICILLDNTELALEMGKKAREKILNYYMSDEIPLKIEKHFVQSISKLKNEKN